MGALHWLSGDSWRRFGASVALAAAAAFFLPDRVTSPAKAIAVWDFFATSVIVLAWIAIAITPPSGLRAHARAQDLSRLLIFSFVVAAACVALLAVAFVIRGHGSPAHAVVARKVLLGLSTVAVSWFLLHTVYSLHYAHLYYGDSDCDEASDKGLDFPGDKDPDYLDFAYFAFVIGMTCQVSDVQVTTKRMRRITLLHGVISFGFNTVILALLINTISGLL
ncbi:MAG: DUF1345 domain-containing protein [Chthoniobacterales bacterium]